MRGEYNAGNSLQHTGPWSLSLNLRSRRCGCTCWWWTRTRRCARPAPRSPPAWATRSRAPATWARRGACCAASAADILLVNLPAGSNQGLELVSEVKLLYPDTSVIAMTASGSVNAAVEAMRCGASDYLTKPFAMDELSTVLDRAAASHMTDTATRQLRERLRLSAGAGRHDRPLRRRWRSSTASSPRSPRARTRC